MNLLIEIIRRQQINANGSHGFSHILCGTCLRICLCEFLSHLISSLPPHSSLVIFIFFVVLLAVCTWYFHLHLNILCTVLSPFPHPLEVCLLSVETCGKHTFLGTDVLLYMWTVHQTLYTDYLSTINSNRYRYQYQLFDFNWCRYRYRLYR